jgi:hypothetical protein
MNRSIKVKRVVPDGYTYARRSCTVFALALALDVDFNDSEKYLISKGLKNGSLYSLPVWRELFGYEKVIFCNTSITKALQKYNKGVFIFHKTKHVFCVKDGVILDRRKKMGKNIIIDYIVDCN